MTPIEPPFVSLMPSVCVSKFLHDAHHVLPVQNAQVLSDEANMLNQSQPAYRTCDSDGNSAPGDGFEFGELLNSVVAPFPANAALLESAEDTGDAHPIGLIG